MRRMGDVFLLISLLLFSPKIAYPLIFSCNKSHLAFPCRILYHLQKKQTREDTAMMQHVYKKKFLPAGVSIFIDSLFIDIISFDR